MLFIARHRNRNVQKASGGSDNAEQRERFENLEERVRQSPRDLGNSARALRKNNRGDLESLLNERRRMDVSTSAHLSIAAPTNIYNKSK